MPRTLTITEGLCMNADAAPAPTGGAAFLKLLQAKPQGSSRDSQSQAPHPSSNNAQSSSSAQSTFQSGLKPPAAVNANIQQPTAGGRVAGRGQHTGGFVAGLRGGSSAAGIPPAQQPVQILHQTAPASGRAVPKRQADPLPAKPAAPVPVEQLLQRWSQPGASQHAGAASLQGGPPPAIRQSSAAYAQQPRAVPQHQGMSDSSCLPMQDMMLQRDTLVSVDKACQRHMCGRSNRS